MRGKRSIIVLGIAAAAAILIGLGLYRVLSIYHHYRTDMLGYESRHLNSIVSASARGMDWILDSYRFQAERLIERQEFSRAEEEYLATGDEAVMEALMGRPDVLLPAMPYNMAVYNGAGDFLAAAAAGFPQTADPAEPQEELFIRSGGADGFWFVFRERSSRGLLYELAVPVDTLFSYSADAARVGKRGVLFLMDRTGAFFAYAGETGSGILAADALPEAFPAVDPDVLTQMRATGAMRPEDYTVQRYPWEQESGGVREEESLVVLCPLNHSEPKLIYGAALSFGEFNSFLSGTLREVAGVILLGMIGTFLLFALAAWILVMNRRNALELRAVKERADMMEEINRQQQSLYHGERLQQLGLMTSGVVHEFNNLLTPIMSQSYLLLEQLADQEESPAFDSALDLLEASENARDVLRRMSAIGKNSTDMSFRTLELGGLLRRTLNLASMAKNGQVHQKLDLPEAPIYVEGNDALLTQAFLNLCINAGQAMEGKGTLTVQAQEEERSGHPYVKVEVSDTGPGIPEEKFSSLYEPFFTTKGEKGTGLGLAICRKIVESHKGTITAANRPEGGAVFTVRIPVCPAPAEEP